MKSQMIIAVALLLAGLQAGAQGLGNFFTQNQAQMKYMLEKRLAFGAYKKVISTGYSIAKTGLKTVNTFKDIEFGSHKAFFKSLKSINPVVKKHPKIPLILQMQMQILLLSKSANKSIQRNKLYTDSEMSYITKVLDRLTAESEASLNDLIDYVTASQLDMRDDERMEQIEGVYLDVLDMYGFVKTFTHDALMLGYQRKHETLEINNTRRRNGLPLGTVPLN